MSQINEGYRKVFAILGALSVLLGVIDLVATLTGYIKQSLTTPLALTFMGVIFLVVGSGLLSKTK